MRRTRLLCLLILGMAALRLCGAAGAATLEEAISSTREMLAAEGPVAAKDVTQAREALEDAIKQNPTHAQIAPARLALAQANLKEGRFHAASESLKWLREQKPENVAEMDVFVGLVYALNGMGDYFGAIEWAQHLLRTEEFNDDPRRPDILYQTALHCETVLRRPREAAEYYRQLAKEHPKREKAPGAAARAGWLLEHRVKDLRSAVDAYMYLATAYPKYEGDKLLNWEAGGGWTAGWRAFNIAGVLNNNPRTKHGLADFALQAKVCEQLAKLFPQKREAIYWHMLNSATLAYNADQAPDGRRKASDYKAASEWGVKALEADPKSQRVLRFLLDYGPQDKRIGYVINYLGGTTADRNTFNSIAGRLTTLKQVDGVLAARPDSAGALYRCAMLALDANKLRTSARDRLGRAKQYRAEVAKLNNEVKQADARKKQLDTDAAAKEAAANQAEQDAKKVEKEDAAAAAKKRADAKKVREEAGKLRDEAKEVWTKREQARRKATNLTNSGNSEESSAASEIDRAQKIDPKPENQKAVVGDFSVAKKYIDRLTVLKNRSSNDQTWIGRAVERFGRDSGDLDLLLAAAREPRYGRYARAMAWREAARILAGRKDAARAIAEMRKCVVAVADQLNRYQYESHYRNAADAEYNYVVWPQIREAFGDNGQAAYDALKKIDDDESLWWSGWAFRELLRHELGKLAYGLGKKDAARQHFTGITSNHDLSADGWLAYFELAHEANDLEALLHLGIAAKPKLTHNLWNSRIHRDKEPKQLKPAVKKLLEEGKFAADEKAYFDILAAEMERAKAPDVIKLCDDLLAKFAQSKRFGTVALKRARLVRSTLKKNQNQIGALADWLTASAAKIKNTDQRAEALRLAGDYYGESGEAPATPRLAYWSVVGPFDGTDGKGFDKVFPPEQNLDLKAAYPAMKVASIADKVVVKDKKPQMMKWLPVDADKNGYTDLKARMSPNKSKEPPVGLVAYVASYVASPAQQEVLLYAGSQQALKVWLNGQPVITANDPIGYEPEFYMATVKLNQGSNTLLVKGVLKKGSWGFSVRLGRLSAPATASSAPGGGKKQALAAAAAHELKMWSPYAEAAKIAKGAEKTANIFRPFERIWDWGRGTEARGGYRSLLATDEATARRMLVESYRTRDGKHNKKYPLVSGRRYCRELAVYVKNCVPENRNWVYSLISSTDRTTLQQAADAAEAYIEKHPGHWDIANLLWQRTNQYWQYGHRERGIKHAVQTVKAYPEYRWLMDTAVSHLGAASPELTEIRYNRTKNNHHLLDWTQTLYTMVGGRHRNEANNHASTAARCKTEADKHEEDSRRDTSYARQKTEQAKSFEKKAQKATDEKKKEDAEQFAAEAKKLLAEVKKHEEAAKNHLAEAKTLRDKAQQETVAEKKSRTEFEKIRDLWVQRFTQALQGKLEGVRPNVKYLRTMLDIDRKAAEAVLAAADGRDWDGNFHAWRDVAQYIERYIRNWDLAAKAFRNALYYSYSQNEYMDVISFWAINETRAKRPDAAVRPLELVLGRYGHVEARAVQAETALCDLYMPTDEGGNRGSYVAEVYRFLYRYPGSEAAQDELGRLQTMAEREGDVRGLIENIAAQIEKTRDENARHDLTLTMARLLYGSNRHYDALRALKPYPASDTAAAVLRASLYWKVLDYTAAFEHLARARVGKGFGIDSMTTPPWELMLAMVQYTVSEEDYDGAFDMLDETRQLYADTLTRDQTTELLIARVDVLVAAGDIDTAFPIIKQIQAENLRRSAYWIAEVQLGKIDYFAERYAEGLKRFDKVAKLLDPATSPRALFWIGKTQLALGKPDAAIETFRELWENYGEDDLIIRAIYLIGQTYRRRGDFVDAIRLFESVGVMRAATKDKVVPGEDVVLKVVDPDYAVGTGKNFMEIDIETTGGDFEKVRVDINPISRALFVGSIKSKLAEPRRNSGLLELRGNDVITVRYIDKYGKMTISYGEGPVIEMGHTSAASGAGGLNLTRDIGTELFGGGYIQNLEKVGDGSPESAMQGYIDGAGHKSFHIGTRFLRKRLVDNVRLYLTSSEPRSVEIHVLKPSGEEANAKDWLLCYKTHNLKGGGWHDLRIPLSETRAVRVTVPDNPTARSWRTINELEVIEGSASKAWDDVKIEVDGTREKIFRLYVVDTGEIEISSVGFKDEDEEGTAGWRPLAPEKEEEEEEEKHALDIEVARRRPGVITPGNTVFVRLKDKDFDISGEPETIRVSAYTRGRAGAGETVGMDSCTVELVEIGTNVGEFRGLIRTRPSAPTISASDTAAGFSPDFALNNNTTDSAWQAQIDGLPGKWIEVDLKDVYDIAEVQWTRGEGADDRIIHDGSVTIYGSERFHEVTFEGNQEVAKTIKIDPPVEGRYVRLKADFYDGDAPVVAQIVIKDAAGNTLVPTSPTPEEMRTNNVLELNVGDSIQVEYLDEENVEPGKPIKRISNSLAVRYDNAGVSIAITKLDKFGRVEKARRAARINTGDVFQVLVQDVDVDKDDEVQKVEVFVGCESGDTMKLVAEETRGNSGSFSADVETSNRPEALDDPNRLYVREGDSIWATYLDEQNMVPGHKTIRSTLIFEATPTSGSIVPPQSYIRPVPDFMGVLSFDPTGKPKKFANPTVGLRVLDPDAAVSPFTTVPVFVGAHNTHERRIAWAGAADMRGTMASGAQLTKMLEVERMIEKKQLAFGELIFTPEEVVAWKEVLDGAGKERAKEIAAAQLLPVLGDDVIFFQYVDEVGATGASTQTQALSRDMVRFASSLDAQGKRLVPLPDSKEFLEFAPVVELKDPETEIEKTEAEREEAYMQLMGSRYEMYAKMLDFQKRQHEELTARFSDALKEAEEKAKGEKKGPEGAAEGTEAAPPAEGTEGAETAKPAEGAETGEAKPPAEDARPEGLKPEDMEITSAVGTSAELSDATVLTAVEILQERLVKVEADLEKTQVLVEFFKRFERVEPDKPEPEPEALPKLPTGTRTKPYFLAPAPGYPFRIWITDRDLTEQGTCKVLVRTFHHGLRDRMELEATLTEVEEMDTKKKRMVLQVIVPTAPEPAEGVLHVGWGNLIHVQYEDAVQEPPANKLRRSYVAFASDSDLRVTQKNFMDMPESLRVGEALFVSVVDLDRDVTYERDNILVEVKSEVGDTLAVMLTETAPRSGEFRGRLQTAPGEVNPNDAVLQCTYGGEITVQYKDYVNLGPRPVAQPTRPQDDEEEEEPQSCVVITFERDERGTQIATAVAALLPGSDGDVTLFARNLKRGRLEKETLFSTGYCYYMLGRSFSELGSVTRAEEVFARARDDFKLLIRRYAEHKEVAHATFYLGNIEFVRKYYNEAIGYYRAVIENWPKTEFVAETRLRMGMAYEKLGRTNEAIDQYAYLAFHHKNSPYVKDAMVNMVHYFDEVGQKAEKAEPKDIEGRNLAFSRLVSIASRFLEKFPNDSRTPKLVLRAGLRMISLKRFEGAAELFAEAEKAHAESKYMPAFLYWHAEALLQGSVGESPGSRARVLLQRVIYDFENDRYSRAATARIGTIK